MLKTIPLKVLFRGCFRKSIWTLKNLEKNYTERNAKLCAIVTKIAEGLSEFSTESDILGDAYEYLIGQFASGSGKKAGEFYTPQQISTILSRIVTLDSQNPASGKKKKLKKVLDFACGSGSLLLNVRKQLGCQQYRADIRSGKKHYHLQPCANEHAAPRIEGFGISNSSWRLTSQ